MFKLYAGQIWIAKYADWQASKRVAILSHVDFFESDALRLLDLKTKTKSTCGYGYIFVYYIPEDVTERAHNDREYLHGCWLLTDKSRHYVSANGSTGIDARDVPTAKRRLRLSQRPRPRS